MMGYYTGIKPKRAMMLRKKKQTTESFYCIWNTLKEYLTYNWPSWLFHNYFWTENKTYIECFMFQGTFTGSRTF